MKKFRRAKSSLPIGSLEYLLSRGRRVGECLIWDGALRNGYGIFSYQKVVYYAHIRMLEHKLGRPVREDLETKHSCDVRACIEQNHLSEGTHISNIREAAARGRMGRPIKVK